MLQFEDTTMPKTERPGRTREENPFDPIIAKMISDGWVGTEKGKAFTVPGVASLKDNELLRKYRRQLTNAGDASQNPLLKDVPEPYNTEGVTVLWNAQQTEKKTGGKNPSEGVVTVKFSVRAKVRQNREDKSDPSTPSGK